MRIGCYDLPQNGIVETKLLMTDAIADRLDLRPRLRRVVGKPVIRNMSDGLGDGFAWRRRQRGARSGRS